MTQKRVLVTGGSGFIAGHCILQLLEEGYRVRTTVRSLEREATVRATLTESGMTRGDALEFVAADLTADDGWTEAVADCDSVLHVASPVRPGHIENEDELIRPARDGAVRVLRAAHAAGIRRVVLTSAFHAAGFGQPHRETAFTEADWSPLTGPGMDAYGRSKVLAERAAWDFAADAGEGFELVTILPVAVMGPVMGRDISGSNHIVQRILNGAMPGYPNIFIPIVDVRDVARAHVLALTSPEAAGERFLIAGGASTALRRIGELIVENLPAAVTAKVPTVSIPDDVIRAGASSNPELRATALDLGYAKKVSTEKARRVLGWAPHDPEAAVIAAAESMVRAGLVAS